mgnify:FL=1
MATPEATVKTKIKKWLKANDIWYCTPIGSGFGSAGVPDFICSMRGRFLGIEAKAPGKLSNLSELQKFQRDAILASGGLWVVIDDPLQLKPLEQYL